MNEHEELTIDEAIALSDEAIALGQAIGKATLLDSDGGRQITREERRTLLRQAAAFLVELTREALD